MAVSIIDGRRQFATQPAAVGDPHHQDEAMPKIKKVFRRRCLRIEP